MSTRFAHPAASDPARADRPGEGGPLFDAIEGLQRLSEIFRRRRRQLAREAGLTDVQWQVLEEVGREDFMPSLFARSRDCTPAAVSRTLRQLQDAGLVRAAISEADGRQREYTLTPAGEGALARVGAGRERAIEAVWRSLPEPELARFAAFSAELADRLEAYARAREADEPDPDRDAFLAK